MKRHSVIANLNPQAKKDLNTMLDKLYAYTVALSNNNNINAFWVHENDPLHYTSGDGETFAEHVAEGKTWDKIVNEIKGLSEFVEDFHLAKGVVVVSGASVPAHKHDGGPDAQWSLTVMRDTADGLAKFYYEREDREYTGNEFIMDPDSDLILAEEFRTKSNGIYSFNTSVYHSWKPDHFNKISSLIYVFYLKNTTTREEVCDAIAKINQRYG